MIAGPSVDRETALMLMLWADHLPAALHMTERGIVRCELIDVLVLAARLGLGAKDANVVVDDEGDGYNLDVWVGETRLLRIARAPLDIRPTPSCFISPCIFALGVVWCSASSVTRN